MNLPILIRDEVWEYLQSTDLRSAKEVQQCIKKVEKGQFDFGLRVKKLKGISQRVWEARINQASRLLFTYRSFKSSDGQVQTYRAIESICVEHDDVNHQARVIGRNWEGLEIVEILGNLDLESDQLNSKEHENIHLWEREEIEIQVELIDELLENIKWLILEPEIIESEEEWQNAIESGADLNLRLTPKESELINIYGNVLISGSAGTGKTTVGLYRLARTLQMNPAAMCLYVAYNPILVKESEEQFKRLWGSSYENLPLKPSFLTIRDLCLKITKDFGKDFDRHLVDYPQFYQRYIKKPESREYPPSLIWDEIRSVIKGANLKEQSQAYLLSEKEYESLSKKRSEVIQKEDRHTIYKLAEWYQEKYLSREQLADEIDLTRAALQVTKIENYNPYTLVVCDEVQDFTEIQLEFLIRLIAKGGQILCAGDINQMISPSGFRWGDLTTRLHAKNQKWTKENLSTNFRSTGKLVSLAVKILNLKFKLLPESQPPEEVRQNITGELARLVEASSDSFKEINLGAADAILVRTEKRKQELNKTLETTLVFTIEESKGLEFDTVYLIDFFENSRSLWTTALNSSKKLKEQEKPELCLEFNLLYVAITRARRLLNICEVERSDLWKRSELVEHLISMSVDEVFNQTQFADSQDWYKRAIYYRDARLFVQALECATKSGDEILTQEIEIESLLLNRKYDEAAQLLLKIEKYSEAAKIFEKTKEWVNAAKCWELAGDLSRKHECDLQLIKCIIPEKSSSEKVVVLKKYENNLEEKIINKSKIFNNQDIAHSSSLAEKQDKIYIKYDLEREKLKRNKKDLRREKNTELNLHSAEFYYNNAIAKLSLGDNQGAISDYDLAIKLNPGYSGTYNNRGLIKSDLGDKQGAISDYDLAIKLNSNHPEIYNNRGVAKLDLGDKQGAISDYDLAIKLNPCYVEAYTNRGYVKYLLGDNQGAICDCKQAIRINPNHANAYNNLGLAQFSSGDVSGSVSNYNRAIQLDPNYASAYNNRGNAKLVLQDYHGANTDIIKAQELFC